MSAIAVLGSCSIDLVVRQPRLARPGETIFGTDLVIVPGGKGLNQAIAAARAGGAVDFLGVVGEDDFGAQVRECLRDSGVGVQGLRTVPGPTGTAHIAVLDGGENAIAIVPAANSALTRFDDSERLAETRFLVAQFERPLPLIAEAFTEARARGITTVLTPAPVQDPGDLLELTDILVPNAIEACELAGVDDELEAAITLSRRAGIVVMTRGDRGCVVVRDGVVEHEIPARQVEVVDTTAAGDSFVGALVAWLAEGAELLAAVRAATVAASLCVTRLGTSSSIAHRAEIDAALAAVRYW